MMRQTLLRNAHALGARATFATRPQGHVRALSEWCRKSLLEASTALQEGKVTAVQLTQACIDQIEATRKLNMFVWTDSAKALELAKESDARRAAGQVRGSLDGIPIGVKDLFCMENVPTTAASKILEGFVAPYESTATAKLLEQGAIPLGKLNMDEFAMGSGTLYTKFGATINPWSSDLDEKAVVAGGSSGGSAAAVASGCCFAALGSDTGGSVRQPAAYCGIVGLKPSYGRVSRHGMISYASSLDTPGIFTRTVGDAAVVLKAIAGPDDMDSTCMADEISSEWCNETIESSLSSSDVDLTGVRVGIPHEYFVKELPDEILAVWDKGVEWLRDAGAQVVSVSLPTTKLCIPAYYIIACAEASSNLSRYDGVRYGYRAKNIELEKQGDQSDALHDLYCRTRSEGFGEEVQRRILSGTFVLSAGAMSDYYERAVILRQKIRDDFQNAFKNQGIDVLMTPTTPSGPFAVHNKQVKEDPVGMYLNDVMTIPANMAGVPAISIPASLTSGDEFPLGLQLMGARKTEEKVLQVANALERHAQFSSLIPESVFEARR
uniref:Glutamyl-tRNA(Gln) amidotransferase subunit A, mitochondrial n=1 Tax=Globisporangium ultimum (strain ATCC 200006 / CBS 805.95 / DAOM BR144) TaxID=431595 RepID=K3X8K8_GLOUD